jgi:hypothetical protein
MYVGRLEACYTYKINRNPTARFMDLSVDDLRRLLATLERTSPALTARVALSVLATGANTTKLSSSARSQLQAFSATPARIPTVGEVVTCVFPLDPPALPRKCTGTAICRSATCQAWLKKPPSV